MTTLAPFPRFGFALGLLLLTSPSEVAPQSPAPRKERAPAKRPSAAPRPDEIVLASVPPGATVYVLEAEDLPNPPWMALGGKSAGKTPTKLQVSPGRYSILLEFPSACLSDFNDGAIDAAQSSGRATSYDMTGKKLKDTGWRLYAVTKEAGSSASIRGLCVSAQGSLEQLNRFYGSAEKFVVGDQMAERLVEHGITPADAATAIKLLRRGGKVWVSAPDGTLVGAQVTDAGIVVGKFETK